MSTRRGNTLLEIVFATAVFAVLLVAVASLIPTVMRANRRAQNELMATQLAQQMVEQARAEPFPCLTNGGYTVTCGTNQSVTYPDASAGLQFPGYTSPIPVQQPWVVQVGTNIYTCSLQVTAVTYHGNTTPPTPRFKQITAAVTWDGAVTPVTLTTQAWDTFIQ